MPENILIASVLKPVNDTRLYHKIAKSLTDKLPEIKLHIVGFQSSDQNQNSNIRFYPLFNFKRLNYRRIFANWQIFILLREIKPALIIIATFELLPAAIIFKLFYKTKLVYDVQENYARNVLYTKVFPFWLRYPLAGIIRLFEKTAHPFVSQYWLAEECYIYEMPFVAKKAIVLENKFKIHSQSLLKDTLKKENDDTTLKLIYTGTIARDYGIFRAIYLTEKLHKINSSVSLTIAGYCASKKDLEEINTLLQDKSYIKMLGGDNLLPHHVILEEMQQSDVVLLPYYINKSVENRIPTKMFECMALSKLMLVQQNPVWQKYLEKYDTSFAYFIDYDHLVDLEKHLSEISKKRKDILNVNKENLRGIYWKEEELKLIEAFKKLTDKIIHN